MICYIYLFILEADNVKSNAIQKNVGKMPKSTLKKYKKLSCISIMNLSSVTYDDRWGNIGKAAVWEFDNLSRYIHFLTYFNLNFVYSNFGTPLDFLFNPQLEELY